MYPLDEEERADLIATLIYFITMLDSSSSLLNIEQARRLLKIRRLLKMLQKLEPE